LAVRILSILLTLSVLLNAAGIVFLCCFVGLRGDYRSLKIERNVLLHNLTVLQNEGLLNDFASSEKVVRRSFVSQFDGKEDIFGFVPAVVSKPSTDYTLVVYLHGMGSTYLEPFVKHSGDTVADTITKSDATIVFISPNCRGEAAWGGDAELSDITQNIREIVQQYPIQKIIIIGCSMGGCVALNYAACAPQDIKEKLAGIVSIESSGDLMSLFQKSKHPNIKYAMIQAFGGTPEQVPLAYAKRSFIANAKQLPTTTRVAIVSADKDVIVPPEFQSQLVSVLEANHVPVKLITTDTPHGLPSAEVLATALNYVLSHKS
jgi:predicted esterase